MGKSLYVLVAKGKGWTLAWPRDSWDALTAEEQENAIRRQKALMEGDKTLQNLTFRGNYGTKYSQHRTKSPAAAGA